MDKARQPYESGMKVSVAISHGSGLAVGTRSFPGSPYDGHTLGAQLEHARILLEDVGAVPHTAHTDLGFRGVAGEIGAVTLIHRGKLKTLTKQQRKALKRRQAVKPVIGHMKQDSGMGRCWLLRAIAEGRIKLATLDWVHWYNHKRLLEPIGHIPPTEAEAAYYRQQPGQAKVA